MGIAANFVTPGVLFLLTLASGVWLSRSGKPLSTPIFTLHKLIALGAVVVAAIQTYNALKKPDTQAILIAPIILIGLCVVALFATGALMSANKPAYGRLLTIHRIALLVVAIAAIVAFYLLSERV